ncbi:MAG: hypothetical protein ACJ04O_12885, partial [Cellvibrionales bacterium]
MNAGNDQMAAAGQLDELTARASDSDGSVSRYIWSQDDGDYIDSDALDSANFSMPAKPQSETFYNQNNRYPIVGKANSLALDGSLAMVYPAVYLAYLS